MAPIKVFVWEHKDYVHAYKTNTKIINNYHYVTQ